MIVAVRFMAEYIISWRKITFEKGRFCIFLTFEKKRASVKTVLQTTKTINQEVTTELPVPINKS
jgi:hypothetical protein